MNKKFLSAILFGALAVASTGSFVSCKDYDDDIDNLQAQISALTPLSNQVSDLKSQIATAQSAADKAASDAQKAAAEATSAQDLVKKLNDLVAKAATKEEADQIKKIAEAAEKTANAAATKDDLKAAKDAINDVIVEAATEINGLKTKVGELESAIAKLATKEEAATKDELQEISNQIKALEDQLAGAITALKSIVFQPELYIDGIEAAKYTYLKYVALTPDMDAYVTDDKKNNLNNTVALVDSAEVKSGYTITQYFHTNNMQIGLDGVQTDEPNANWHFDSENGVWLYGGFYVGDVKTSGEVDSVKFAVNPANAVVTKEQAKLIAKNIVAATRTAHDTAAVMNVTAANVDAKGILTIKYTVDSIGALISANHWEGYSSSVAYDLNHKNTTMFHAEVTNTDKAVIESDWAMLYENAVQPVAIAWNEAGVKKVQDNAAAYCDTTVNAKPELYKNIYEALEAAPSLSLGYNDAKGIDLYKLLELHMVNLAENYGCDENGTFIISNSKHNSLTLDEAKEKYGLTVKFTPVAYETEEVAGVGATGNKTQPSNYINPALGAKGHVVAGIVKASDGSFDKDATSYTKESDGVSSVGKQPLVQVLVMKGADVVLEGYIKLTISRKTEDIETPVIKLYEEPLKYNCEGLDFGMSWFQASTIILENTMHMGKDEFDANYKLQVNSTSNKCAIQYVKKDGKFAKVDAKDLYAIIVEGPDPKGTTNTVLHVGLDKYAQQYILEKLGGKAQFTVKYIAKSGDAANQYEPGVFVNLEVAITEDTYVLGMKTKIPQVWYNADGAINQEPDEALRANVKYPKDGKNSYTYTEDDQPLAGDARGFYRKTPAAFEVYNGKNDVVLTKNGKVYASIYTETDTAKTKFYFHPAINKVEFKGDDNKTYKLSVDNDFVFCDIWREGDGAVYGSHSHRSANAILKDTIENISAKPLSYINELAQTHKLNASYGIFENKDLYCTIINGTDTLPAIKVATINVNNGEVHYLYNETSKSLLNAAPHTAAKAKAFIGVYAQNTCGNVLGVTDGVFPMFFFRPLDLDTPKAKEVVDAKTNASLTSLTDLLAFQDWRDIKINTEVGNGNLLAYYGVKSVKIDLNGMTTTLGANHELGKDSLLNVSREVKFSLVKMEENEVKETLAAYNSENHVYVNTTELDAYNVEATYGTKNGTKDVLAALLGGDIRLKYENNGFNTCGWSVRIPVIIGYDWGSLSTYVDVTVVETIANGGATE